ncbi:hypothetical protein [Acidisphaera sp. L21]|uniref:hypothetical protein n=1 Tax=Acidisphaera sp. L21 TaxID=1641851 RepID=UPI00131EB996|nr:hypothetical protein [Acidisphaera sp. L21]
MSEQTASKAGPTMAESVEEVQGIFPSDAAMQDAIAKLTLAGFDRADLSLPATHTTPGHATPNQGAADPMTDTDVRQARTMGTSMAGAVGAMAAAGATIATGGAAGLAIAAAAAVGAGSALAANAAGTAAKVTQEEGRDEAAAAGELVLAVHAATPEKRADAERIMQASGASKVASVSRVAAAAPGMDSSAWTG